MNPIHEKLKQGTFGEIYVQLRLLLYNVQAAPPIKDTGNDLIAIIGQSFRAIQVKTTKIFPVKISKAKLPNFYHVLAIVVLDQEIDPPQTIKIDKCALYLIKSDEVEYGTYSKTKLERFKIDENRITAIFNY